MSFRTDRLSRVGFTVATLFTALGPTLVHATMADRDRTGAGGASSASNGAMLPWVGDQGHERPLSARWNFNRRRLA
jgi:hypothetical protein